MWGGCNAFDGPADLLLVCGPAKNGRGGRFLGSAAATDRAASGGISAVGGTAASEAHGPGDSDLPEDRWSSHRRRRHWLGRNALGLPVTCVRVHPPPHQESRMTKESPTKLARILASAVATGVVLVGASPVAHAADEPATGRARPRRPRSPRPRTPWLVSPPSSRARRTGSPRRRPRWPRPRPTRTRPRPRSAWPRRSRRQPRSRRRRRRRSSAWPRPSSAWRTARPRTPRPPRPDPGPRSPGLTRSRPTRR